MRIFKLGNALFVESQYAQALAKYREAVTHWDHPAIRYNMAVCMIHLDQPVLAYETLIQALRYGAAPFEPDLYEQAQTYKKLLLGQLAELTIKVEEPDTQVSLDGEQLFVAPGEATRLLAPGAHQLVASKNGFLTESRALTLVPGQPTAVALKLVPLSSLSAKRRFAWWKPWALLAAGVAVAAVGVPLQLDAQSNMDSYDRQFGQKCPMGCHEQDLPASVRDLKSQAELENGIAVGTFIAGGALVAGGLVLIILNQPRVVEAQPKPALPPLTLVPTLGPGRVGATLCGSF